MVTKATKKNKVIGTAKADTLTTKITLEDALAELNRSIEEQEKAAKDLAEENTRILGIFEREFGKLLILTILPALNAIVAKFNKAGNTARISNKEDEKRFNISASYSSGMYASCYFKINDGVNAFALTIFANKPDLKVGIEFDFFNNKKIKKEYELGDVTHELIEMEVTSRITEIAATIKK